MVALIEKNPRPLTVVKSLDGRHVRGGRPRPTARRPRLRPLPRQGHTAAAAVAAPAESDPVLIDRLRQGDVAAGDRLVVRYHRPLMRYLQWLAGPEAAEDLHQQTWLSVLDHLDDFDTRSTAGGFKAWLFRIASNKAKDRWRSRGRERDAKAGLGLMVDEQAPDSASCALDLREQGEKLRQAMALLPDGQREVLVLRYYSNLKFVDIAAMLGCPLNTALTRAHKGLTKLRHLMHCA